MTSIQVSLLWTALALSGAPGELPPSPSAPAAPPPSFDSAFPIERQTPPRRGKAYVRGRVVSRGAPVAYAQVWAPAYRLGDLSREDGSFAMTQVPAGPCTLQVQGLGYIRARRAIVVENPGLDSLILTIDPVSWPVPSCDPWFEVDPVQGDSRNARAMCGNGIGNSATVSRSGGHLSIAQPGDACNLSIRWWWGRGAARVVVRDSSGAVVRTLFDPDSPSLNIGRSGELSWDGTRDDGTAAAVGEYRVRVEAPGKRLELVTTLWASGRPRARR